ncbi:preprotein translocase subunit YajC [Bifidobacterium sp. M0353]|uniref:preprotein translocase subunit YajC n=1 Tax=Bifidobacterium sp. M0353 TaxID=2751006 RepID=UPI0018DB2ED0|nr:preprotein translocase subunit YajC [Bifidobacterium sp. M0353]MBI0150057.1 preprotein translocase subunit YajC [Bifidobacterium sp. M0353]
MGSMIFMIVIIALMIAMMWGSSRKSKQQQAAVQDFRQSLQPGDEVATTTGLLGKVVSVDLEKEQVVIDSEGSQSRWRIQAITQPPIVPAYIHDDEVDENGNPLPEQAEDADAPAEVTDAEDTTADDAATENSAASEDKDEAESRSDSEPEPEDESDKAETEDEEKSDEADESEASEDSKTSDSTSDKS